jgi:hypothetical protein
MAFERDLGALILEAPFTSAVDVAAHRFPVVPVRWLMADRFDSLARIGAIEEPLLVMHGDADFVIRSRPTGGGSTKPCAIGRRLSCSSSTIHIVSRRGTALSRATRQGCP